MKKKVIPIRLSTSIRIIVFFLVSILSSCSTLAQEQISDKRKEPSIENIQHSVSEQSSEDFSEIRDALEKMNENLRQSKESRLANTTTSTIKPKSLLKSTEMDSTKMSMGKGTKGQMKMASTEMASTEMASTEMDSSKMSTGKSMGKSMGKGTKGQMKMMISNKGCMGKMCRMKMKDMSMMGEPFDSKISKDVAQDEVKLPGYKNTPHLYHLGEVDFFLNYSDLLNLSNTQITSLEEIKNKWEELLEENVTARKNLETKLWELTSSGEPEFNQIKSIVSKIETTNTLIRLSFIKFVGNAVATLFPEQIKTLGDIEFSSEVVD